MVVALRFRSLSFLFLLPQSLSLAFSSAATFMSILLLLLNVTRISRCINYAGTHTVKEKKKIIVAFKTWRSSNSDSSLPSLLIRHELSTLTCCKK